MSSPTQVPLDLGLLIRPARGYSFASMAERLSKDAIPHYFGLLQPGGTVWYNELLLAVVTTPGVRNARIVRLGRASEAVGVPPEKIEFSPEEIPSLGQVVIERDPHPPLPPPA